MPFDSEYKACPFPYKRHEGAGVRGVPSGMGLPDVWTEEMDRFICYCEAVGDFPLKTVIVSLKKRFPQLEKVDLSLNRILQYRTAQSVEINCFRTFCTHPWILSQIGIDHSVTRVWNSCRLIDR